MSAELLSELKSYHAGLDSRLADLSKQFTNLQEQTDAIDKRVQGGYSGGSAGSGQGDPVALAMKTFLENKEAFQRHGRLAFEIPSPSLQRKAITSSGLVGGITYPAIASSGGYRFGNVEGLFLPVPITGGAVFQVAESTAGGWNASPQSEASEKNESVANLTAATLPIECIATWVEASKQAAEDVEGLEAFLRNRLLWSLAAEVDAQLVSGSGVSPNLYGLTTSGTAFDTALLTASLGWDRYTIVGAACAQVRVAGFEPNFVIMHPYDAYRMRFTRSTTGEYVASVGLQLPRFVETTAVTEGTFIVGDSSQALFRVRQTATIDVSESHGTNFTKNILTWRAEQRCAFQILTGNAFVYGSFSTSPA